MRNLAQYNGDSCGSVQLVDTDCRRWYQPVISDDKPKVTIWAGVLSKKKDLAFKVRFVTSQIAQVRSVT